MFHEYFPIGSVIFSAVVTFGVIGIALWRGFCPVDVDRWATARGLTLTPETRAFVLRRLQLGRRVRTIGFAIGWSVPFIELWIVRDFRKTDGWAGWTGQAFVVGYLLAALGAEVWFARGEQTSGAASLERRDVAAYLPRWARLTPRIAAAGAIAMTGVYAIVPWREAGNSEGLGEGGFGPSVASYFRTALILVAVVAVIELCQRFVVRRRQPFSSAPMVEADDALRSASVNILAGIATALSAGVWSTLLWDLGSRTDVQVIRWVTPFLAPVLVFVGLGCFVWLSDHTLRWRVRRHQGVVGQTA